MVMLTFGDPLEAAGVAATEIVAAPVTVTKSDPLDEEVRSYVPRPPLPRIAHP